ncbi:arginine--tRNA ligase [Hymenobacter properus]|uniref:Arginine--tRNA ligase n=1 Tax=Hymenobacter properus TaxID=2791026 RepID=A0A931FLH3_9BACT|nr:arginine--tRNA ligase [Hymenobacter properus]MBF9144208.1 arginine--tRNA ligase [Hymenobacter properus]MBR7723026.1 arginine--tRNA ligase [Microvirga sp. SRT04]
MQQLESSLKTALQTAAQAVFGVEVPTASLTLQPTRKEFAGSFTLVTFPLTKALGKGPEQIGQALGEWLKANEPRVRGYNVVKGFLNIEIADAEWLSQFEQLRAQPAAAPVPTEGAPQRVVVEYSSPNTNKPLHLGHLRNNFLGYSVAEILKATGATVTKANLVNDRGIHICKSMIAYQHFGQGETPQSAVMKGDHLAGKYYVLFEKHYREEIKQLEAEGVATDIAKKQAPLMTEAQQMLQAWEAGDPEVKALWSQMNGWVYEGFDATYKNIGVDFDQYYYESETYLLGKERVEEGLGKGVFFKKDNGSVWVDLQAEGLDEKLLLRADGTSVYITQDLGTAELKYQDFGYDSSIYVIADEQNYHMQVLQATLKKLGKPYADAIHHLSYGMVDLPSGKMKSREGTVVDADELVRDVVAAAKAATLEKGKTEGLNDEELEELYHTLGLGALKYYLLKVDPKKRMLFNPEESVSLEGHTGPFIQYSHARIAAIRRKAAELGIDESADWSSIAGLEATEQELIQELARYAGVVAEAARNLSPAVIAQYAYDLAKAYNRFYAEVSIFQETDPAKRSLRVALSARVGEQIKAAMGLLGIQVPERM